MSNVDPSTNPQIEHDAPKVDETGHERMEHEANKLAGKAGRVQSRHESGINDGAVSPGGGGIFSK